MPNTFSIDDDIAVIDSSNMDIRSFSPNSEVSLLVRGEELVASMRKVEEDYRDAGRDPTLDEWRREPKRSTVFDGGDAAHIRAQLSAQRASYLLLDETDNYPN